jgi:hypothetical protein
VADERNDGTEAADYEAPAVEDLDSTEGPTVTSAGASTI